VDKVHKPISTQKHREVACGRSSFLVFQLFVCAVAQCTAAPCTAAQCTAAQCTAAQCTVDCNEYRYTTVHCPGKKKAKALYKYVICMHFSLSVIILAITVFSVLKYIRARSHFHLQCYLHLCAVCVAGLYIRVERTLLFVLIH
jgi:hypothetical protein